MNINTERLFVRDFAMSDAADLHEIFGDAETMEHCEPPYDFEKTTRFLEDFCIGRKGAFAAVHKESGKVIGYILFNGPEPGCYEMGWIFNRSYWRQGYAHESCSALIEYAFTHMNVHKVWAEAMDAVKSVGLMKKLGMKFEGIQRKHTLDLDGNWADLYYYGLLKEECK